MERERAQLELATRAFRTRPRSSDRDRERAMLGRLERAGTPRGAMPHTQGQAPRRPRLPDGEVAERYEAPGC